MKKVADKIVKLALIRANTDTNSPQVDAITPREKQFVSYFVESPSTSIILANYLKTVVQIGLIFQGLEPSLQIYHL